jgi:hypothetical protein
VPLSRLGTAHGRQPAAICSLPPEAGHADRACCPQIVLWCQQQQLGFRTVWHGSGMVSNICLTPAPIGGPCLPNSVERPSTWLQLATSRCSFSPSLLVSGSAVQFSIARCCLCLTAKGYAAKKKSILVACCMYGYVEIPAASTR